ncbi:transmembrane adipocyte-associated 1 -like protein, partial [Brachionus plicatilis]
MNLTDFKTDNGSWYPANFVPFCLRIQTYTVTEGLFLWDVVLLVPNVAFTLFLLAKRIQMNQKLKKLNFPIIKVFYHLILAMSILSISRCLISVFIKPNTLKGQIINK